MREMITPKRSSPPERAPTEKYAGGAEMGQPCVLGQDISDTLIVATAFKTAAVDRSATPPRR